MTETQYSLITSQKSAETKFASNKQFHVLSYSMLGYLTGIRRAGKFTLALRQDATCFICLNSHMSYQAPFICFLLLYKTTFHDTGKNNSYTCTCSRMRSATYMKDKNISFGEGMKQFNPRIITRSQGKQEKLLHCIEPMGHMLLTFD